MAVLRRWLVATVFASLLCLVSGVMYVMGIAWWPGGTAPSRVLNGSGCPTANEYTIVAGPQDRPAEDAEDYPPGRDWSLLDQDPDSLPGGWLASGYGAERWLKARLPWRVRFRVEWDSEGSMLAVYGNHEDICLIARVVAAARG